MSKTFESDPSKLLVRVGEWEFRSIKEPYIHEDYEVDFVKLHPNYAELENNMENNVALVFTKNSISFYPHIRPVCLPVDENTKYNEKKCVVAGWGKSRFNDKTKNVLILKEIELPIYNRQRCEENYRKYAKDWGQRWQLHESSMCAGGEEGVG